MKWRFWLPQNPPHPASCGSIEPLLSLLSDGMASPGEARLVESHLHDCEGCRRALEWMQATHLVISKRPAALPPPDLRARIARSIADAERASRPLRPLQRPSMLRPASLAAATLAAVAAFAVLHESSLPAPAPVGAARPTPAHRQTASVPHPHAAASVAALRDTAVRPVRPSQTRIAAVSSQQPVPVHPPKAHPALTERLAKAPAPPTGEDVLSVREPVPAKVRPAPPTPAGHPAQMASVLKDKPRALAYEPRKNVVATALPKRPLGARAGDDAVISSPELAAPPPPTADAVHPEVARVAVTVLSVSRPVHVDALSNVRSSIVALNSDSSHKIFRNSDAHVQTSAYSTGDLAPMVIHTNWTPGLDNKPERPRGNNGTQQN